MNNKRVYISVLLITSIFLGSYISFTTYRPKVLKQVEDVKGLKVESNSEIPYPEGSEKISTSVSSGTEQITFKTTKSKQEVQDYYKNIFSGKKWELDSQGVYKDFIVSRYKHENKMVNVMTYDTQDPAKTLVSIETSEF